MTNCIENGKILAATATGSVVAAVLTSLAFALGNVANSGIDGAIGFIFVVGLIAGIPIAIVVGVPVGFVLSRVVTVAGPPSRARAIAAGSLTGLSLTLAAIATGIVDHEGFAGILLWLGGALAIGAMSGAMAYRLHFQPWIKH